MPLSDAVTSDPSEEGRERLRGAYSIAVSRIRPDPEQPRRDFSRQEMEQLTASVRQRGIRQPLRVWFRSEDNMYQIVSGERRYRAAVEAGLSAVPCIVEDPQRSQVPLERKGILIDQIVENWQRADLNPYELSDALIELRDRHGYPQTKLAEILGKPESEISRLLSLQRVEATLQKELRSDVSGTFTRRHLIAVAKLPMTQQQSFVNKIKSANLTAVETEREAVRMRKASTGESAQRASGAIQRFTIGTATVQITFRKRDASDVDVLDVLRKVIDMVITRSQATSGNHVAEIGSPKPHPA